MRTQLTFSDVVRDDEDGTWDAFERFRLDREGVRRFLTDRDGRRRESLLPLDGAVQLRRGWVDAEDAERFWLRSPKPPISAEVAGDVRVVDLFCGCGGLSLGIREACVAVGKRFVGALALDLDPVALAVYRENFSPERALSADISELFDREIGSEPSAAERAIGDAAGPVQLLLGGPPCEGHSDFNNRTRHSDKRNDLYLRMVRAAEVFSPEAIIVENVPGALRDRRGVVQRTIKALEGLGYLVTHGIVEMIRLGVPQTRRRLVLVAARERRIEFEALSRHFRNPRSLRWAIDDLEHVPDIEGRSVFDTAAKSAPETRRRINHLFERDLFDLPDDQRPACHANKRHSYKSVYGRLRWEEPAQTITTGFFSMCMGRYVHPSQRRTITAHEAARIQFFPDYFDFSAVTKRGDLTKLIGDAVPMKLGYVLGLEFLA